MVVDGCVVPDQVEVLLEVIESVVLVCLELLLHGGEVHGSLDDIKIVRHLGGGGGGGERERERGI